MRTYFVIVVGVLVQLAVTLTLFFGSRKFHESYGFFSNHVNAGQCRRGYEWQVTRFKTLFLELV
jgi:hypothetical protein